MRDQDIQAAARAASISGDPSGRAIHEAILLRAGRVDECALSDRHLWQEAPDAVRASIVREISNQLGEAFDPGPRLIRFRCDIVRDYRTVAKQPAFAEHELAVFIHKATGIEMALLPGQRGLRCILHEAIGEKGVQKLTKGSPELAGKLCHCQAALAPFLAARTPCTESQWINAITPGGFLGPEEHGYIGLPNVHQGSAEIDAWCRRAGLRLPTVDEWRYLAKAGSSGRFYWGDTIDEDHCWLDTNSGNPGCETCRGAPRGAYCARCGLGRTSEPLRVRDVREHDRPGHRNAFGMVDVIGNVWELLQGDEMAGGCYASSRQAFEVLLRRGLIGEPNAGGIDPFPLGIVGFRPVLGLGVFR